MTKPLTVWRLGILSLVGCIVVPLLDVAYRQGERYVRIDTATRDLSPMSWRFWCIGGALGWFFAGWMGYQLDAEFSSEPRRATWKQAWAALARHALLTMIGPIWNAVYTEGALTLFIAALAVAFVYLVEIQKYAIVSTCIMGVLGAMVESMLLWKYVMPKSRTTKHSAVVSRYEHLHVLPIGLWHVRGRAPKGLLVQPCTYATAWITVWTWCRALTTEKQHQE